MICGLLGGKLGHSYSPQIHAELGDYKYRLFERAPEELDAFFADRSWTGVNVTIPYKRAAMKYCDVISERALRIGCVNTVVREADGLVHGYNTDYDGFLGLVNRAGYIPRGKKALILGSGGASLTAQCVLGELGAEVVVVSRSGADNYENVYSHTDAALIVNATPVGMYPRNGERLVDLSRFPKLECVLDVVYNPALSGGDDGDGSASTDGDDGKNADERRDELDKWTQVNDYILSALTNVHRVIDELDMDVTVLEEDADGKAFSDLLKATMADGDRRLRALGFDITSILHVAGGAPSASPSLAGIANDLLRETYANIARHAQSGSKADLSVILKPNAVEITQINQERAFPTEGMRPGGHGLAYFGKQLESHGGKLETTLHDGEWTLFAYLPIPVPETLPPLAGHPES